MDARVRLLDAAEELIRRDGYEAVSVRAVNKAAGMNPSAVHYHFGSKPALVAALLERRLGGEWEGRLTDLDLLARGPEPPDVTVLARLLVEPMARLAAGDDQWLLALLARLVLAGHRLPWRSPWSEPGAWIVLFARALPELPTAVVAARWRLARDLVLLSYGAPFTPPAERTVPQTQTVIAFVAAGLAAEGASSP